MVRLLVVIALVQLLALALLAMEVRDLHEQVAQLADTPAATAAIVNPASQRSAPVAGHETVAVLDPQLVEDIRLVVRDELEFALAGLERPAEPPGRAPLSEEESLRGLSQATAAIDVYTQVGQMSPQEMSQLQQQIARLNPEHRQQALQHLVRAMNSGQLDARL